MCLRSSPTTILRPLGLTISIAPQCPLVLRHRQLDSDHVVLSNRGQESETLSLKVAGLAVVSLTRESEDASQGLTITAAETSNRIEIKADDDSGIVLRSGGTGHSVVVKNGSTTRGTFGSSGLDVPLDVRGGGLTVDDDLGAGPSGTVRFANVTTSSGATAVVFLAPNGFSDLRFAKFFDDSGDQGWIPYVVEP